MYVSVGVQLAMFLKKKAEEKEGLSQSNSRRNKVKIEKIIKKLEPRKIIEEEAGINLLQIKVDKQNSDEDENGGIEDDTVKNIEENYREDIKEEKGKEDTKEEQKSSKENEIGGKLKEILLEDKTYERKEFVQTELERGSKRDIKKVAERQHKTRCCHRRSEKLFTKGTRGAKDFENRRNSKKTRLFQDKEDRRKHEEALVSRLYKIS